MSKRPIAAFLSCEGYYLNDDEMRLFEQYKPAGITLFARNIQSKDQLQQLIAQIKMTAGDDVLIAVDQEGGRVRRLKEPLYRAYASQKHIGSLDAKSALKAAKLQAKLIAQDLKEIGINVNFAPVLDIEHDNMTQALATRCFSEDKKIVARLGKAMVESYSKNGIIPCIKHLPGHGLAQVDPHLGLPVINADLDVLKTEFYPFCKCANAPMGMTAHIVLEAIDNKNPITLSKKGIKEIIRGIIGFDGFLISDAIDMHALKGTTSAKALASLNAGCDCVCYCFGKLDEMKELCKSCPQLKDKSLERLDIAKQILHNNMRLAGEKEIADYSRLTLATAEYTTDYDATEVLHNMKRKQQC